MAFWNLISANQAKMSFTHTHKMYWAMNSIHIEFVIKGLLMFYKHKKKLSMAITHIANYTKSIRYNTNLICT